MEGRVTSDREALIDLTIHGTRGSQICLTFVIDTGFTGYISMGLQQIEALELERGAVSNVQFANGLNTATPTYRAKVDWDGERKDISVLQLEDASLAGMHLLSGSRLTLEATRDGIATIEVGVVEPFDE